jgi:hypothetical protein
MAGKFLSLAAGLTALVAASSAIACGQMGPVDATKPAEMVVIRGYGYGFEGGDRPVVLVWSAGGAVAGTAQIDAMGNFQTTVQAPAVPGQHDLLVLQGAGDPAPATVTVTVLGADA